MPTYIQAKSKNQGELFHKCATEEVAARNAAVGVFGDDFSLVKGFNFHIISQPDNNMHHFHFSLDVNVPAYPPVISMAMNVANNKDVIDSLVIKELIRVGASQKGKIVSQYTAKTGQLVHVAVNKPNLDGSDKNLPKDTYGTMTLSFKFEQMTHEDNITNTSGMVKTSDA
jgi:hypothetical protein